MKQKRQQIGEHSPEMDWAERLRDHLADYEAPVPDDLWEKIEASLPKDVVAPKKKARIVPLWAKWTAAAVFMGAVIGTGISLWPNEQESVTAPIASIEKAPVSIKSENSGAYKPAGTIEKEIKVPAFVVEKIPMESENKAEEMPSETFSSEKQADVPIQPIEPEKSSGDVIREVDQKIASYRRYRNRHTTINLYASNGFGNQSYRNGVLMSQELLSNYDYYTHPKSTRTDDSPVYLANHEERQKLYQPISIGLSVNIPISSAFSISSGIVYTRLSSDFTSIANSLVYEQQQTLHYVGIPLTVLYNLWQWHGLNVYVAAGGQADFNVKASVTTEGTETRLKKDDLQWSVNAALGVQYNFIPQLGIYAEPGIKYYFDNGSHIHNFFKYRPTNFNLQVGLRLNVH